MSNYTCDEVVILDFETTGLSADYDRIIEVGAVVFKGNKVVDSFSELMDPGCYLPSEITALTGITRSMLKGRPCPEAVMPKLKKFIGDRVILAHNASFDSKFLHAEMRRARIKIDNPILCTMLLSRRLIPDAYNYKLGTLAKHLNFKIKNAHRALDDVNATARIWEHLYQTVSEKTGIKQPDSQVFATISKKSKNSVNKYFEKVRLNTLQ